MKRAALLAMLVLALGAARAQANYSFAIPKATLECWVNPDASATLEYNLTFHCNEGAQAIDIVDIGMPTGDYDISNMKASLDGQAQTTIQPSQVVHPGVEVHLQPTIAPGKEGTLTFRCTIPNLVFQDTTNKDNAYFRITPTWYDSNFLTGTTDLAIVVYLPKDIKQDEVLYQSVPFSKKGQTSDKTVVAWTFTGNQAVRLDSAHLVGVSFPKRDMQRVVSMSIFTLFWNWWTEDTGARGIWGVILLVATAIFFFRMTSATGCVVFVMLAGMVGGWMSVSPGFELTYVFFLAPLWIWGEKAKAAHRHHYLPAIASVAGGGIKRGLTTPEAAIVLEQPLGRVLTLVLFGLLTKGVLRQVQAEPLIVELTPKAGDAAGLAAEAAVYDQAAAPPTPPAAAAIPPPPAAPAPAPADADAGVVRSYEQAFLAALAAKPGVPVHEVDFDKPLRDFVLATAKKLAGFDLEQTKAYYLSIVNKAWQDAKALGDVQKRTEFVDDNLGWMMLSPHYGPYFNTWHGGGYYYSPVWLRGGMGAGGLGSPATNGVPSTGFSDVAASFAGWSEHVTGNLAGALDPVKVGLVTPGGANLAGADRIAGDIFSSLASGGGGGMGGGGCACAGCACACACAGGGR
jgi:hypothetical protein